MDTTIAALLHDAGRCAVALQRPDGSMPPGHNGPYHDPETPVRNTSHWLIAWSIAGRNREDARLREAANRAVDYLQSAEARPLGFAFPQRNAAGKDHCNGVIGQSFVLDALVEAHRYLGRTDVLAFASDQLRQQTFHQGTKLWHRWEIDGRILSPDYTLNHQLWFAASVANLNAAGCEVGRADLAAFLAGLPENMRLRTSGRIQHDAGSAPRTWRGRLRALKKRLSGAQGRKENAYHGFNLQPLALMKLAGVRHPFLQGALVRRACTYLDSRAYRRSAEGPGFCEPHIPAGFPFVYAQRALVEEVFGANDRQKCALLCQKQVDLNYNASSGLFDRRSVDPVTQAARVYELARMSDAPVRVGEGRANP